MVAVSCVDQQLLSIAVCIFGVVVVVIGGDGVGDVVAVVIV